MRDLLPEPLACGRQRVGFKLRDPRVNLKEMFGAAMLPLEYHSREPLTDAPKRNAPYRQTPETPHEHRTRTV